MSVEFGGKAEYLVEIQFPGWRATEYLNERGIVLWLEFFDAKGVTPLVCGFGELTFCAEDEFLFCFKGIGAQAHHDGIEITGPGIEMTAGGKQVE